MSVAYSDAEIEAMFDKAPAPDVVPIVRGDRKHSWLPIDLASAALSPPEPPSIEGVVYPGRRHVFSGEPESLKSFGLFSLYVSEMRKGKAVFHIDFEMGRNECYERVTQLGATAEDLRDRFIFLEPQDSMLKPDALAAMTALVANKRPSIVGIDAFTSVLGIHGIDQNDNAGIDRFYITVLNVLRRQGAAVIVLDHVVKTRDARGKYSIGGERKIGACDVHLGFQMTKTFGRGTSGKATLTVHKDRPGHLPRHKAIVLDLWSSPETGEITYKWEFAERIVHIQGDFKPTHYMTKICRYVGQCAEPPTQDEAEDQVGGKREWAHAAVEILIRDGYLRAAKNERGEKTLKWLRHYEDENPLPPPPGVHGVAVVPVQPAEDFPF